MIALEAEQGVIQFYFRKLLLYFRKKVTLETTTKIFGGFVFFFRCGCRDI